MKISRHDKQVLLELEFVSLLIIIILGALFYKYLFNLAFYIIILLIGFSLYFWMLYEEKIHRTGKKHAYFEHTSSYIMLGQTALVLALLFIVIGVTFLLIIFKVLCVIMYSVSLARILLYKEVFKK
ncbi:hypothetical protein KY348_07700 [Candidatus Woesearchaeota archaeon]|nr:hypothetical protein [Candidatus Woesearchaeota archaeon]